MKKDRTRTISSVITNSNSLLILATLFSFGFVCLIFIYFSIARTMISGLKNEAKASAKRIEWVVQSYKNIAEGIGSIPELSDPDLPVKEKMKILDARSKEYGLIRCGLVSLDGFSEHDGKFRGDRRYFMEAQNGRISINDPVVSRTDGQIAVIVGAPVWKNGIYSSEVDSVLFCSLYPEIINDIVKEIGTTKHSRAYIIGTRGLTVASTEKYKVISRYSNIIQAENNPKLKKIAKIENEALYNVKHVHSNLRGLSLRFFISCPIEGTPGWTLMIESPLVDYLSTFFWALLVLTLTGTATLFISRTKMKSYAENISLPVRKMAERLQKAATGDFTSEVIPDNSLDEVKVISGATQKLVSRMDRVLNETAEDSNSQNPNFLLNLQNLTEANNNFEQALNLNISIYDKFMNRIFGSEPEKYAPQFPENITISKRIVGKLIVSPKHECTLSVEQIDSFLKYLSRLIDNTLDTIVNRERHYHARRQNDIININSILSESEKFSNDLFAWIYNQKDSLSPGGKNSLVEIIYHINEFTEYTRFASSTPEVHESDYQTKLLAEKLDSKTEAAANKRNIKIIKGSNLKDKLFGDHEAIIHSVSHALIALNNENLNSPITVTIDTENHPLSVSLKILITIEKPSFSKKQISHLELLAEQYSLEDELLSSFENKIISSFKLVRKLNGTVKINSDSNLHIDFSFPQLLAEHKQES